MIEICISIFPTILLFRRISFLRESSLNRIWAIPVIFVSFCFFTGYILGIEQNTPMRYVFVSYILYQLINLANTSRRIEKFIFLNQAINGDNETEQRINSLLKSRTILSEGDCFRRGSSPVFFIYWAIARIVLSTRKLQSSNNTRDNPAQKKIVSGMLITSFFILLSNTYFLISRYPTRDSLLYHFNSFEYLAKILRETGLLPSLFPAEGGVSIELSSMSFGLTSVHKFLGFLAYSFLGEPYLAWKIAFIAGVSIYCNGIFLIAYMYSKNMFFSIVIAVLASFIGIGNAFHQEQVLYTAMLLPYIYLLMHKNLVDPNIKSAMVLMAVFGFISFVHFPQIQIVFIFFTLFVLWEKRKILMFWNVVRNSWWWLIIAILSTSVFTLKFMLARDEIVYPLRIAEGVGFVPRSIENILLLNRSQASSGATQCGDFSKCIRDIFVVPSSKTDDLVSLYMGPLLLILLISIFIFQKRIAIILAISILLFLGPSLSWWGYPALVLQFIFLEFRQWYHFFPIFFFFFFLGIVQLYTGTTRIKFAQSILFKRSVLTLLVGACFLNFGWKTTTYKVVSQVDKPPNITESDGYFAYLRNPNIINLKSQYIICKNKYSRVEPYQYPEVQPIGLLSTNPNSLNSSQCIDTSSFNDFVSIYGQDMDYQKESLSPRVSYIESVWDAELPSMQGNLEKISILNGGRIYLTGWIESKIQPSSIILRVSPESFECAYYLEEVSGQEESQPNLRFQCIFEPSAGRTYGYSDFQIIVISESSAYNLPHCCDALSPNNFTFVPLLNNPFWNEFKIDVRQFGTKDLYFSPLWNVGEWDSNVIYSGDKQRKLSNQNSIALKEAQYLDFRQPSSTLLSIYFLFLYLFQITLIILTSRHCASRSHLTV
jgi:hypothetical protein